MKAGGIRFNRSMVEQHEVESLSDIPSEYLRIELKSEPLELPPHTTSASHRQRVAALKMSDRDRETTCEPHQKGGSTDLPSIVVNLNDRFGLS